MENSKNLTQEAKQLLRPIKDRPDLQPSPDFVKELYRQIMLENTKKKQKVKKLFPLIVAVAIIFILPIIILSYQIDIETTEGFLIEEFSRILLVDTINYGSEEGEIGLSAHGINPVSSFDIEHGTLYLLDEVNSQVVIRSVDGNTRSFPIHKDQTIIGGLEDILVTEDENIFILNSVEKIVYQYHPDGKLAKTYDLTKLDLFFPDALYEVVKNEIIVGQNQNKFANLQTMSFIDDKNLPFQIRNINRKESLLVINDKEKQIEIPMISDLGIGNLAILEEMDEQIIYMQTVTPPVNTPISETHIYGLNKQGSKLGGVRIPEENFIEKPQRLENYIKIDQNKIYLVIPENEHVALYEITLGKQYESFIEEQVERVNVGFDYKTFGEPFPELEIEIRNLLKDDKIQYGNENSLNGASINKDGTVIIDFKDFLAGSPASAEAQHFFNELYSATFEKFPEIQQIYFQFDGSFSAWVHWLESIEEPWKRLDSQ